jgi:hypothetical protein
MIYKKPEIFYSGHHFILVLSLLVFIKKKKVIVFLILLYTKPQVMSGDPTELYARFNDGYSVTLVE